MRKISTEVKEIIEALSAENLLKNLPVQVVEKDVHVTDFLVALSKHPVLSEHGIKLIFCGGTCLSKAWRLIHRMSEDVDLKVVMQDDSPTSGDDLDPRLDALYQAVEATAREMGFDIPPKVGRHANPDVMPKYRFYVLHLTYESVFGVLPASLRPELKVEIIARTPRLPLTDQPIGYLMDDVWDNPHPSGRGRIQCISVADTLAEKVVSFLRRYAESLEKPGRRFDAALVRHIYDVSQIVRKRNDALKDATGMFADLVASDARDFPNSSFGESPKAVLLNALDTAKSSQDLRTHYEMRVAELVFDPASFRGFDEAFADFDAAARELIEMVTEPDQR